MVESAKKFAELIFGGVALSSKGKQGVVEDLTKLIESRDRSTAVETIRAHNYSYIGPSGRDSESHKPGHYYCLCGWEGPDRDSYWKHLSV